MGFVQVREKVAMLEVVEPVFGDDMLKLVSHRMQ